MKSLEFWPIIQKFEHISKSFKGVFPLDCVPNQLPETSFIIVNTE